jgi:hypothetical protein
MIKMIEKRIINPKKDNNRDDISFSISEVIEEQHSQVEFIEKEPLVTEKDINSENINEVTNTNEENIVKNIEIEEEKEKVNDNSSLPLKEENIVETDIPLLEEKDIINKENNISEDNIKEENKEIINEEVIEDKKVVEEAENVEVVEVKKVIEEIIEIEVEEEEEEKDKVNEEIIEAKVEEEKDKVNNEEIIEAKVEEEEKDKVNEEIIEAKVEEEIKDEVNEDITEVKKADEVVETKENVDETNENVEIKEVSNDDFIETHSVTDSFDEIRKDSIILKLSEVITSDNEYPESYISEQNTSVLSTQQLEIIEEPDQINKPISEDMMQALIQAKEDEYKAFVEDEVRVEEPSDVEEVVVVEESDNYPEPISQDDQSINQQEMKNNNSNYGQPLKAEIIDLSNESIASSESIEEEKQESIQPEPEQEQEHEIIKDISFSDGGAVAAELNDFTNALKSINDINNAEKQFLIPNSEVMEKMINKSLQRHQNIDSLNVSASSTPRNSLEVMENMNINNKRNSKRSSKRSSNRSSNQSGKLQLQILPPPPPPAAPLPPTPHGTLPPQSIFIDNNNDDVDSQSTSSSERKRKGHLQHYSLGRLTEIANDSEENEEEEIQNAKHNSVKADNSIPLNSNVQTVTIQDVKPNENINEIKNKNANNSQPLQAEVFKIDSEGESVVEYSNTYKESSNNILPEQEQEQGQEQGQEQEQEQKPEQEQEQEQEQEPVKEQEQEQNQDQIQEQNQEQEKEQEQEQKQENEQLQLQEQAQPSQSQLELPLQPEQSLEPVESLIIKEEEKINNNNDTIDPIPIEKQEVLYKNEASKTSSKKLKDTFSNIENLLDDLDSHIHKLNSTKDGYEGDDEIRYGLRKGRINSNIPNPATQFIPGQGPVYRNDYRNSAMPFMEGPIPEFENGYGRPKTFGPNQRSHLFNNNSIRPVSYNTNNINMNRKPYYNPNNSMIVEDDDILVEGNSLLPETMNDMGSNRHQLVDSINEEDEFIDIDQSINNNLRMLKDPGMSSPPPPVIRGNMNINMNMNMNMNPGRKMNIKESPAISTKALKLVGVENQSIPNMSNKALKMLGMNTQSDKVNDFANFQFNEKELAMLNAAPITSPHLSNRRRKGSNTSASRTQPSEEYMPFSPTNSSKYGHIPNSSLNEELDIIPNPALNPNLDMISNQGLDPELDIIPNPALNPNMSMNMNMNMKMNRNRMNENMQKYLQEEERIKQSLLLDDDDDDVFDINDDLMRDPNMLTMGSSHSNNSGQSYNSNSSFPINQKAMKVFGISENDMMNSNGKINNNNMNSNNVLSPRMKHMNIGTSPINNHMKIPSPSFDNLNLSRYSINDGENQINGIISSKALKIIGLSEPPTQMNINLGKNGKRNGEFYDKKGVESSINKKEKIKEWEEVGEYLRDVMPTLGSLKPIMSDYLFLVSHGLVKSWKKRFVILTQDNWIYYFNSNNPKDHARASIPINSTTRVRELMDPFNIVPYFIEIVAQYSNETNERRFITIGCDTKQKCQYWLTSIKSLIARDKFSNAKLPPKPDMDNGSVTSSSSSTNKYRSSSVNKNMKSNSPIMSPIRAGRNMSSNSSTVGDLGSLYDDIPGYSSSTSNINNNNNNNRGIYNDLPLSPSEYSNPNLNQSIRKPVKNLRMTKQPPARKESFKPRYASMLTSPTMSGYGNMGNMGGVVNAAGIANFNGRTQKLSSPSVQSTIPMISSSPLMKSQLQVYSPYANSGSSPLNKGVNINGNGSSSGSGNANLNENNNMNNVELSPNLTPMALPSVASPAKSTPKSIGGSSFKQGESTITKVPSLSGSLHSPVISPKSKPLTSPLSSPFLPVNNTLSQDSYGNKFRNNNINSGMLSPTEEDVMNFDYGNMSMTMSNMNMELEQSKQQKMQELILKQQQEILALKKRLYRNQQEMEQGYMDMSKDKNFY